jgi:hypothetical protein
MQQDRVTKLQFPVSLESIVNISLEYGNLKVILEYILSVLQSH